ncbi:hypothetical protein D3C73_1273100 [compost metagenome]
MVIPVKKILCFSFTFFFNSRLAIAGTSVKVKMSAPSNAKLRVQASGENILPSTFSKVKMGSNPVMIMSLAKRIPLPFSIQAFLMKPSLLILLKRAMPTFFARISRATKIPSTITTAPSIIIPKSMAPIESKLAGMPFIFRQINAKSKARGIMMETMSVVRQSAMKRKTIRVTNKIPSSILPITVCTE